MNRTPPPETPNKSEFPLQEYSIWRSGCSNLSDWGDEDRLEYFEEQREVIFNPSPTLAIRPKDMKGMQVSDLGGRRVIAQEITERKERGRMKVSC